MALSLMIKRNLNEKIRELIANLEEQVNERTKQIQKVMTELKEANLELQLKNKKLADMVERDNLTGLYNHSAIHRRLNEWFEAAVRNFFPIAVIMMDVDNFKEFNDNFGHQAGDEILLKLAAVLKSELHPDVNEQIEKHCELRKYDVAARYGGDEFIVVLPYCGQDDAEKVVDRLIKRFQDIKLSQSIHMTLSVSMGVSVAVHASKIQSSKSLVKLADQALYNSKVQGKNRITFLHPE
jgi:diguanylate cyclase (GGDEF)-like protein